jgi:hypothetical protein
MKNKELSSFINPLDRLKQAVAKDSAYVKKKIAYNKKIIDSFHKAISSEFLKNPELQDLIEIKEKEAIVSFGFVLDSIEEESESILLDKCFECDEFYTYSKDFSYKDIGRTLPVALKNTIDVFKSLDIEFKISTEDFECFFDYEENKLYFS